MSYLGFFFHVLDRRYRDWANRRLPLMFHSLSFAVEMILNLNDNSCRLGQIMSSFTNVNWMCRILILKDKL